MNAEKFISSVGAISDKYIIECANTNRLYAQRKLRTCLLTAACFVLVILSGVLAAKFFSESQKHIVWNENADIHEIEKYYDQATEGNVVITESLQSVFAILTPSEQNKPSVADDECVFAVLVTETTGVSKEIIYRDFVLPLGVKEEYLDSGIVFLTRKQLKEIKCPNNLAIILSLAAKE